MCPRSSQSWKHVASAEHMYTLFHVCFVLRFAVIICPYQATTNAQAAACAGVAGVHRSDVMNNQWVASPIFTLGISNNITPCIMAALEAHYIAGRGEVELEPSADYIPFLYAIYLKIAYRFSV